MDVLDLMNQQTKIMVDYNAIIEILIKRIEALEYQDLVNKERINELKDEIKTWTALQ